MGNKKMIYTVGDSHAWHVWLKIPGVITRPQGPMTMFHFGRDKPSVTHDIPDNSIVCFCWGEIDCRCHVYKHPPYDECIDQLAATYINAVRENVKGRKFDTWIFNVVPPPRSELVTENPSYPFLGSNTERLGFVKRLNNRLRESEFTFVDVYNEYADHEGYLNIPMSDAHVHIADEKPLMNWINKKIGEGNV